MEFRQLEIFIAVADSKSFSRAAELLFLSQSTVSLQIKALEQELHQTLLLRSTKQVMLTEAGETLLRYGKRMLEIRDAALQELGSPLDTSLHLGASTIPSGYLLPPVLQQFHEQHPHIFVSVIQGDSLSMQEKVLDGSVEAAFVGSCPESPSCVSVPLCTDELVLAAPATDYYARLLNDHSLRELLPKIPLIIRERGSGTQKQADRFLEDLGISVQELSVIACIQDLEAIRQMIVAGTGAAVMSSYAVQSLADQGKLLIKRPESPRQRTFYLTWLKNRIQKPALLCFLKAIYQYYKSGEEL